MSTPVRQLPESLAAPTRRTDPFVVGMGFFALLVAAGLVLIALGKRSLAEQAIVAYQLPGLISGCLIGIALVSVGAALAGAFLAHRDEAVLRAENDQSLNEAAALLAALRKLADQ